MKYFKNTQTNEVFGYDETDRTQIPYIDAAIENGWQNITNAWPTDDMKKDVCKARAKMLIAAADWAVLPDVGLKNAADFVTYRGILRGLIISPVVNPDFPIEPTPVWE